MALEGVLYAEYSTQERVLVLYSAYSTPSHAISNARPSIDQKRSVMVVEGRGERGEGGDVESLGGGRDGSLGSGGF